MEGQEERIWAEVRAKIEEKLPKSYDVAVSHLRDLRDLAARRHQSDAFNARLAALIARFTTRPALMDRLRRAGLSPT